MTTTTPIKTTILVRNTTQPSMRCTARRDIPEYGLVKDQVFYLVRSSKNDGTYYICTWNYTEIAWHCTCPATKPCRHIRLVSLECKARKALQTTTQATRRSMAIDRTQPVPVALPAAPSEEQVWVNRGGRPTKIPVSHMTEQDHRDAREAEQRAAYVANCVA